MPATASAPNDTSRAPRGIRNDWRSRNDAAVVDGDVSELRRVVSMLDNRELRARLLDQLNALEVCAHEANVVDELHATQQLSATRRELVELRQGLTAKEAQIDVLCRRVTSTRLALRVVHSQLGELRDMVTPRLATRLLDVATRLEPRDGLPPLQCVRRAAIIVQRLEETRPPTSRNG